MCTTMISTVNFYRGLQIKNKIHVDHVIKDSSTKGGKQCFKRLKCIQQVTKNRRLGSKVIKELDRSLEEEKEDLCFMPPSRGMLYT